MEGLFRAITKYKKTVIIVFSVLCVVCALLSKGVRVDYDLMDYLPDSAPSTIALDTMQEEYSGGIPNARIMVEDVSIPEALGFKEEIKQVDGVEDVTWLDDSISPDIPLETIDADVRDDYYKNNNALFSVAVDSDKAIDALNEIRTILTNEGKEVKMTGNAVSTAVSTEKTGEEVNKIVLIIVPICFIILLLTTNSWFEPVLFMLSIGVAILLNKGTNLMFGTISFVTNAAGSILQLAVSMDYSIFLLHRFADYRKQGMDIQSAMIEALKMALTSITASGTTTIIGFAALAFMHFKIGPDMGWVMAKAIVLSMLSVLLLLPALTLVCCKIIDKTQHKSLMPGFGRFGKLVARMRVPMLVLFLAVLIPSYLAQQQNTFYYGSSAIFGQGTSAYDEQMDIEEQFGKSNTMVLMVPKGDFATETELSNALHNIPEVSQILSYVDNAGAEVPTEYLDKETLSKLISEHYSRMVLNMKMDYEGTEAFQVVEEVRDIASQYYGDQYLLAGESVNTYDLKDVVINDMNRVNLIAILAVFIVLIFSTKSISLPVILVLVIETSIWVNMSVPYFGGTTVFYIAYLIISSIQLGATVDYAILFATRYLEEREKHIKKAALQETLTHTTLSILTSASILTLGGMVLGAVSTHGVLSQLGSLIGRGAVLSAIFVLFILPAYLYYADGIIQRTTKDCRFVKKECNKIKKVEKS